MYIRDIIEGYLTEEQAKEFAEWAWGEQFMNIDFTKDAAKIWNQRHSNLFEIYEEDFIIDCIENMIIHWILRE